MVDMWLQRTDAILQLLRRGDMKKFAIALTLVLVCSSLRGTPSSASTTAAGPNAAAPRSLSSFDPQVNKLLAQMTLEEKVGQMTQAEQDALKSLDDIETYHLGSLLSGGNSDPKEGNSLEAWTNMYDRLQAHTANTRLKIPFLFGIDAVHGHNNVLGAVIFPHNVGLGCARNPKLVESVERATGE